MLLEADFAEVIRNTPLISIDLIVENRSGEFLLGLRTNAPARGSWFVPGGRILKDERLEDAKRRLCEAEMGVDISTQNLSFIGVFEHFYLDNTFELEGFGTHYVVLAFHTQIDDLPLDQNFQQHSKFMWFSKELIADSEKVHPYSKAYFLQD